MATRISRWPLAIVLGLAPGPVSALDITTCGVTVPIGDVGLVQADLACQPGDIHAVALEDRAVLQLNGHTVSNPGHFSSGAAIRCFRRCTILGPGLVSGAPAREFDGIRADASQSNSGGWRLDVRDVDLDSTHIGVEGNINKPRPLLRATNVTVTNSALYGSYIPRVIADHMTATDAVIGIYASSFRGVNVVVNDNSSYGLYTVHRLHAEALSAMNNGEEGVKSGGTCRLIGSTITENDVAGDGIDIESHRRPRLFNTLCGRSVMDAEPFGDWDVCAND